MNNIDTLFNILQHLNGIEIIICSTTNNLFYKVANNELLWSKKLNTDFFNNGILSEQNNYKELYKKYYWLYTNIFCIQNNTCPHDIHPYLPIPKLSPDTNYITESHNTGVTVTNSYIKCLADNGNYIGFGNIKLLFFTKYPLESTSVINLIRKIKLRAEGFEIGWYKINLMIMQKLNRIRLSEIFYEVNKSWCYEVNIHFNTVENWLPTLGNKNIVIEIYFWRKYLFDNVHLMIDHITSEKSLFMKMFTDSTFCNHIIKFDSTYCATISHCNHDYIMILRFRQIPMGIFIYLTNEREIHIQQFEFDNIMVTINEQTIKIQQKEIFTLETNVYYVPMALANIKKCCWNNTIAIDIIICINNINWNKNNLSIRPTSLCFSALCYYNRIFSKGVLQYAD